ncbi:peptidase inhibitor family I36 protein [Peterkaempfera sp. SMS 1(5)a]|uniref:peptidase inhibitor family I36 protein n=1 Tax=Peterkaempfera podocarpi TaxID=3232308 RepID=UPI00366F1DD9
MNVSRTATLAAALATAATLAFAPTAQARVAPSATSLTPPACAAGALCGYAGENYTGGMNYTSRDKTAYATDSIGFAQSRSVYNNGDTYTADDGTLRGHCVTVYSGSEYSGRSLKLKPHTGIANIPASFGHVRSNRWADCTM